MFWLPLTDKQIAARKKYLQEQLDKYAQPWDEDKVKFEHLLLIDGNTYDTTEYHLFDTKPIKHTVDILTTEHAVWSPDRKFVYINRIYPAATKLSIAQGHKRGQAAFSTPVVIPILLECPEGATSNERLKTWMSITPFEMLTQRQGVRRSKGKVLVGGLGMGWLLRKVAQKKSVKDIIVVEQSEDLLNWFGYELCEKISEQTGTPIKVICDDVLNHIGKYGDEVRHVVDIWPSYPNEYDYLPRKWREAINSVEYFWGWGVIAPQYTGW